MHLHMYTLFAWEDRHLFNLGSTRRVVIPIHRLLRKQRSTNLNAKLR
jgi:hypothetical protein